MFTFRRAAADSDGGCFSFEAASVGGGSAHNDLASLAGIDVKTSANLQDSMHVLHGDVAARFTVGAAPLLQDRLLLRNRIWPGDGSGSMDPAHALSQCSLEIGSASGNTNFGLLNGDSAVASSGAVIKPASLVGKISAVDGQDDGSDHDDKEGEVVVVFFDGTGTKAANNVLEFTMDGFPVQVEFTASQTGTAVSYTHLTLPTKRIV